MGIFLIGAAGSRREEYFRRAADECRTVVAFLDWSEVADTDLSGGTVKIDPPSYDTDNLFRMNEQVAEYRSRLRRLERVNCTYLNTPSAIGSVLDKHGCKRVLEENGIAATKMVAGGIDSLEQFHDALNRSRVYSVFIKPTYSSGAAGVVAYRRDPTSGRELAYTSCCVRGEELVNTKTLYCLKNRDDIRELLEAVLSLGVIVERWHPKASLRRSGRSEFSYDLRAVWQFGEIEFMVARQSRGPITNLHLNNAALNWRELGLPGRVVDEIRRLCGEAVKLFPGLRVAGIDVLLEKGTLRPRIIEMNGQGDLMYQDIFQENRIYKRQIEEMRRL